MVGPMGRRLRRREVLIGVEGLALLRGLFDSDDGAAEARLAEVRWVMDRDQDAELGAPIDVPELDVTAGYGRWSATYDTPGNPLISVEQPAVWSLLEASPPGAALDAACGTGRHTRRLCELGHRVVDVTATPEMLR